MIGDYGRNITEIAAMIGAIALIGLLVSHSGGVVEIAGGVSKAFGGLIGVATLQNQFSNFAG